ncbi:hypothetical protein [Bacillus cereus]|uniref:hypothetical protein n=1 Tax=Bacillus cereus TaxID=1396 RepID=UPI003D659D77
MKEQRLNGVWISNEDSEIKIYIERVYKKKDTVDFHYFMCKLMGGGTIRKDELVKEYTKQGAGK